MHGRGRGNRDWHFAEGKRRQWWERRREARSTPLAKNRREPPRKIFLLKPLGGEDFFLVGQGECRKKGRK